MKMFGVTLRCFQKLSLIGLGRRHSLGGRSTPVVVLCAGITHNTLLSLPVQLLRYVRLLATLWTAACQASLSITNSQILFKLMTIRQVMPSNPLILCHPLLLLPSIFPSIRVFSKESVLCTRWPKCWSFSFSISPSNEYSGLISFRMDWLDLLAVQEAFKSLLQHHSSKASILQRSAFFMVQLSHPYMTIGKTIALTIQTFIYLERASYSQIKGPVSQDCPPPPHVRCQLQIQVVTCASGQLAMHWRVP